MPLLVTSQVFELLIISKRLFWPGVVSEAAALLPKNPRRAKNSVLLENCWCIMIATFECLQSQLLMSIMEIIISPLPETQLQVAPIHFYNHPPRRYLTITYAPLPSDFWKIIHSFLLRGKWLRFVSSLIIKLPFVFARDSWAFILRYVIKN